MEPYIQRYKITTKLLVSTYIPAWYICIYIIFFYLDYEIFTVFLIFFFCKDNFLNGLLQYETATKVMMTNNSRTDGNFYGKINIFHVIFIHF